MAKAYTSLVTEVLSNYTENFQLLSQTQEGFRKTRDTHRAITYLLTAYEDAHA